MATLSGRWLHSPKEELAQATSELGTQEYPQLLKCVESTAPLWWGELAEFERDFVAWAVEAHLCSFVGGGGDLGRCSARLGWDSIVSLFSSM